MSSSKWTRRRDIPLAILAWIALIAVLLWGAGHIIRTLLLLTIAALLAYALAPAVKVLQRIMPRFLAVLIVYLIVLGVVSVLLYVVIITAVRQTIAFSHTIHFLFMGSVPGELTPLEQTLNSLGITPEQLATVRQQLMAQVETLARDSFPVLRSAFDFILDTILVAVLSIYLLLDGSRTVNWISRNAPRLARINFLLQTLQRVVGGYIRGQIFLAFLIAGLVGCGMQFLFHLPYAVFLGVLAFIMAFIPVLGTLTSGALCVLIGFTQGWPVAVGVLIYFVVVHVIESDLVGPRVVGKAVGLHPVVALAALVAGSELFGIWGALFASPIAGVLQEIIIVMWREWRQRHPDYFDKVQDNAAEMPEENVVAEPVEPKERG
jgi:predicted PurR-regulated permease PerM